MAENRALIQETMYTQADPLKDVKEVSKNLVSGDFEKQYRDGIMEKPGRRSHALLVLAITVGALAVWMVVLTMVQVAQISRLRHEVDELTANMIAMSANVKSLNQKLANNKLFNEFKNLEDTFYADVDEGNIIADGLSNGDKDKQSGSLEKLSGLTVLEDDSTLLDDQDMYEDDGEESGDFYQDYDSDRRRAKIGTTNMVHLKPDDFTDAELTFEKGKNVVSNIRELKRLLNVDPANPDIASFLAGTTSSEAPEKREKRSLFPEAAQESLDRISAPRVIHKAEERRKTKKFSPSMDSSPEVMQPAKVAMHTVTRTIRSDAEGTRRPFIAAHFHGNTSHLSTEIHEQYKGNGLLRVAHGAAHDVWYPAPWTIASPHPRPTLTRNGHVHVHHTGVYLVYVQIYYLDSHDIISWVLHRTNADIEGRETLLQCALSAHSVEPMDKPNSCFSASALFLKAGDRLAVRNTGGDRHSLMQPEKSFIGLIKLADADDPNEEL